MQYRILNTVSSRPALIQLPASKSIYNRLLIMRALSGGKVSLSGSSPSDDVLIMENLLKKKERLKDAGHAGTVMRFLTAYLSIQPGEWILTGSDRMKNRPVHELVKALQELGADITYLEKQGYPPLKIRGTELEGGKVKIHSGISSQFISALLMTGPYMKKGLELELTGETISSSYIDLTMGLMKRAGAVIHKSEGIYFVKPGGYLNRKFEVEPDWSSASYWYSISGLAGLKTVTLTGLQKESLQGDAAIAEIFAHLGVQSEFRENGILLKSVPVKEIRKFEFDFRNNPDMVQTFIPYCTAKKIPFRFTGCKSLRIKETDRVHALSEELRKFKVKLEYSEDGNLIEWDGKSLPDWSRKPLIETYDDHRMALGITPLCIKCGELSIQNPGVVSKSYPGFWDDLKKVGFTIET